MGPEPLWMWVAFGLFITLMLWLDLAVFNKKSHKVTIRESLGWTLAWMALAGLFMLGIYWQMGMDANAQSKAPRPLLPAPGSMLFLSCFMRLEGEHYHTCCRRSTNNCFSC